LAARCESAVQRPHVDAVQIGFVASLVQSMLVLHSPQAPFVPQTGAAALRIEHA
jgi:hypothetical protein